MTSNRILLVGLFLILHMIGFAQPEKIRPNRWNLETNKIKIIEQIDKSNKYVLEIDQKTKIQNFGGSIAFMQSANATNHKQHSYSTKSGFSAGPPGQPVIIYECDSRQVNITYDWRKEIVKVKFDGYPKLTIQYYKTKPAADKAKTESKD